MIHESREGILDGALAAEQIGYDSVWFFERMLSRRTRPARTG
jgi:hypothetical protein